MKRWIGWAGVLVVCGACSDDGGEPGQTPATFTSASASGGTAGGTGGTSVTTGETATVDTGNTSGASGDLLFDLPPGPDASAPEACDPPDVLIVLDRSQSMHRLPDGGTPPDNAAGHMQSRWWVAIEALEAFAVEFEDGLRLGLTIFPRDPGNGCVDLATRIGGTMATNNGCAGAATEQLIPLGIGNAAALAGALDPPTTLVCNETPIGTAMMETTPVLMGAAQPDREQFVILVTDGGESCSGMPRARVQELVAATEAKVYVVAFGNSFMTDDHSTLNNMACAGQTADGFPAPCVDDGAGNYDAADPPGATLYIAAEDGAALVDAFNEIANELACPPK